MILRRTSWALSTHQHVDEERINQRKQHRELPISLRLHELEEFKRGGFKVSRNREAKWMKHLAMHVIC